MNAQINAEMWSAYLYLAMSMDASEKGLRGSAHWFKKQYGEEMEHAFKFVGYLQEQMAHVELKAIEAVPTKWESVTKMFEQTLEHEKKVTSMIHNLCEIAASEKDYATSNLLQWYVNEQVEEESSAQGILEGFKFVEGDKAAFYMLDKELGKR
ncbi:MAG TPA: ferritin [Porphyromonadaceae bacterium]|nr:ferritin [Porphyromonadaceae bacterium]